ncbi:MAG: pyruvate kinase [Bacteroidota bacterium]
MKIKKEVVKEVLEQLDAILVKMDEEEAKASETLEGINANYRKSAQNLINYFAFRSFDVSTMQKHLKNLGLTRFANAEGHIKASVLTIHYLLGLAMSANEKDTLKKHWSIKQAKKLLSKNTKSLLGYRSKGRRVRIMVTQPSEAADNYEIIKKMVSKGMNCARINCAHDSPEIWLKIINNIRQASKELDKKVKISMDLAGPKIRTGKIAPGPKVMRCKPQKNAYGLTIAPVEITLLPEAVYQAAPNTIPIRSEGLNQLKAGDVLSVVDAREKHRQLEVVRCSENHITAESQQTIYFEPGLMLNASAGEFIQLVVGDIPPQEQAILLRSGEEIWVEKSEVTGAPASFDTNGQLVKPAFISCQMPLVFNYIQKGDRVFFDDGKIGGIITEVTKDLFKVQITLAKENGSRLRAYKGINFPDSKLGFSGLTEKDKKDLPFVAKHADIVNFSFVNRPEDVKELRQELIELDAIDNMGIILKIETKFGFENLVPILLEAMKNANIGVMIARGDLAIETGWENIGKIQQEMLSLCGAAHVPVIWATQVLENLAKSGLPSRSEITDATAALRAECVMLNKGPYIYEAIALLHTILSKMESSQQKMESMLPKIESSFAT